MNKSWESQHYEPLLVTGITGAFEEATEMLRKVTLLSEIKDDYNACVPIAVKDALKIFSNINSGSSKEECLRFLEFLKNIPVKNRTASYDFQRGKTALTDFYAKFEKLRHLVEDRLEIPLERWIQIKEDEKNFPLELDKLNSESENIHEEVEIATHLGDQIPPEMKDEIDRERKLSSASEDSSYQHPFLVRANAERYIELLETFNEKKLEELQKQQNEAKAGFEEAKLKYRKEIRKIMEETLRTKEFAEWLKAKNKARLKEYQKEQKDLWSKFSGELKEANILCTKLQEIDIIYKKLVEEKELEELERKQQAAATTLQAYWRGFLVRRKFHSS